MKCSVGSFTPTKFWKPTTNNQKRTTENKQQINFPLYIAKRYLFTKSSNNAINFITIVASFGVIVGSLALFIILSGFSGFRTFTYSLLDSSDPDIKITTIKGKSFLYTDSIDAILSKNTEIKSISKVIEERVLLQYKQRNHIAYIKGVSNNYTETTNIDSTLTVGQWLDPKYTNSAVIGYGISNKLSLGILNFGEPLQIKIPRPGKGSILNPTTAFSTVDTQIVGVYSGSEEFAGKYIFIDISLAKKLLRYNKSRITSLELKLSDDADDNTFAKELQQNLGDNFKVETRIQFNSFIYKVLNTENITSYFIFTLIVIIALFNVIGAIIMMILDKKQNIKTLFSLGATIKEVKKIFVYQGLLLTLFGLIVGLFIGVVLIFLQQKFHLFMITQSIPYPVEFRFYNLIIVASTISILGFIAVKIASSRIKSFENR